MSVSSNYSSATRPQSAGLSSRSSNIKKATAGALIIGSTLLAAQQVEGGIKEVRELHAQRQRKIEQRKEASANIVTIGKAKKAFKKGKINLQDYFNVMEKQRAPINKSASPKDNLFFRTGALKGTPLVGTVTQDSKGNVGWNAKALTKKGLKLPPKPAPVITNTKTSSSSSPVSKLKAKWDKQKTKGTHKERGVAKKLAKATVKAPPKATTVMTTKTVVTPKANLSGK